MGALLYFAAQIIRIVFHLGISFSCWFRLTRVLLCVVWGGVFPTEEVDEVWDMLSGGFATVNVQIFLEAFLNVALSPTCFAVKAFSGKKQNFGLGTALLKWRIIRVFQF
jgi:hypothetical protein